MRFLHTCDLFVTRYFFILLHGRRLSNFFGQLNTNIWYSLALLELVSQKEKKSGLRSADANWRRPRRRQWRHKSGYTKKATLAPHGITHNFLLYPATLFSYKWFSSATDSDMTLTLARVVDSEDGSFVEGTKGVSMFYVRTRDPETRRLNNIQVKRRV